MAALNLHAAERHATDLVINLGAAVYAWWRFGRPTAKGAVAAVAAHLPSRRWAR
jgi:hypothetical protein